MNSYREYVIVCQYSPINIQRADILLQVISIENHVVISCERNSVHNDQSVQEYDNLIEKRNKNLYKNILKVPSLGYI